MKKSYSLLVAALAVSFWATPVKAAEHYASVFGGMSWFNGDQLNDGFTGTAALGCKYGSTRLEAEMGYQNSNVSGSEFNNWNSDGNLSLYTLMGNGYYDLPVGSGIDIYGTVGVGVAETQAPSWYRRGSLDKTNLAYQFGVGVTFPVADKVKIDARYRYFTTLDNPCVSTNSALIGVQVGF
jgi:opacity protein-like surface antigen